jgi:CcmD family protein
MRPPLLVLAFLAALAAAAPALSGQSPPAPSEERVEAGTTPEAASGLPERAAPPRTLRAYWHVFVAFAVAWVLLFGYTVALGRRFARIERELESMGG